MVIFGIDIRVYFLLFLTYSVAGWCMEVVGKLIEKKKFINRGFLIGPYCPIYGTGAILITFLLKKYVPDPFALFVMAILVCGTLEYLTSYVMEKIYHARWWDYSQRKFNINGRVCLNTIIPFGLLDNIISTNVISFVGKTTKEFGKSLDNTEEITNKVKEALLNKSGLYRRLLEAYPKVQSIKVKIKEKKEEIKRQVVEQTDEFRENMNKQKQEIIDKVGDLKELPKKTKTKNKKESK